MALTEEENDKELKEIPDTHETPETPEETAETEETAESEETEESEETGGVLVLAAVKKLLSTLTTLVLVASLGLLVYVTVSAAHGKAVQVFGKSVLTVVTGSMEPTLHVGDYIFIEKTAPASLAEGDIISFYSEQSDIFGMLVTHRIAKVNADGTFITRGDANPVDDSVQVRPERIVGKYTGKAQFFRWASSFGDFRKLLLLAVMIMTSVAAVYEVVTIGRLKHRLDEEKQQNELDREARIREAIEKEKARLAAEGFGGENSPAEDNSEAPKNGGENAPAEENAEDTEKTEENAPARAKIRGKAPRGLRIKSANALKTPVRESKARGRHKKIT